MKGLLKNQFYGAIGGAAVLIVFFGAVGAWLLISANPSLLNIYVLVIATAFAFNAVSGLRKESSSKWIRYQLTTPVTRRDIVKSRFVNHVFWVLVGVLLSALFVILALAIHGNQYFYYSIRDPLILFCCGTGIALLMGVIFYPVIYLLGTDKSEIIMIISLLGSIGITSGVFWAYNSVYDFKSVSDLKFYLGVTIYMVLVFVLLILSYFLTTVIYRKKEY